MIDRFLGLPGVRRIVAVLRVSYRRKLATALLVVLLISAAAAVGLYVQIGALLGASVEQSMTAATNAEADEFTEWSGQNRLVARVLSEHPVYDTGDRAAVRRYLRRQLTERRSARLVDAYVIDRRNLTVETSTDPALEGTTVDALPWDERFSFRNFEDVRTTRPHEGGNGSTVVGFLTPVRRKPGHLLVVTVEAASLFERFEHPVAGGFTRVVDSNGTVVFADDRSAVLQQYREAPLRAPVVNAGLRGESGFVDAPTYERTVDRDLVAAFAPVEGTDWVVVEHAPASEAYAISRRAGTWIVVVFGIALVGLLAVVAVLGADVTGALATLAGRAERIERGEYDVTFETDRADEFGNLNRTFARTRDTLRQRITELRETKEALDERSTMVSVLDRILRHNVRNDVNSIAGRADYLADRVDDERVQEELAIIRRSALELATVADRTRRIQGLLSETAGERTTLRFPDCLATPLANARSSWPDATISLETTTEMPAVAGMAASLPVAVADVVDQIIAHNDGAVTVTVGVDLEPVEDIPGERSVVVTVDDDGDGLPELDVRAVGRGEETPLDHAEGLALWCLEWSIARSGGELVVDAPDTTVEVRLPVADDDREHDPGPVDRVVTGRE